MKVQDLINKLEQFNADAEVLLASDSEGNSFNSINAVDGKMSFVKERYEYVVGFAKLSPRLKKIGYTDIDVITGDTKPCVILWP